MSILIKIKEMIWAKICLRTCNSVGALPRMQGKVFVRNAGRMEIGDKIRLRGCHVPIELASMPGGLLKIGNNCSINSGASIAAAKSVIIGDNCMVGNYSLVMDTDFHSLDNRNERGTDDPVVLEDDVWLAAGVTVLKGVRIGRGSAVMAGSVVVANVPPYTLVGGVPARTIKALEKPAGFDEPTASSPVKSQDAVQAGA